MPMRRLTLISLAFLCAAPCAAAGPAANTNTAPGDPEFIALKKLFTVLRESGTQYRFQSMERLPEADAAGDAPVARPWAGDKRIDGIRRGIERGQYDVALSMLAPLVNVYGSDYYLRYLEGLAYAGRGGDGDAREAFVRSVYANRRFAPAWAGLEKQGYKLRTRTRVTERARAMHEKPAVVAIAYESEYYRTGKYYPWMTFAMGQALFRFERLYLKAAPAARWYEETWDERLFCYSILVYSWKEAKKQKPGLEDEDLDFLLDLQVKGQLAGWVFFEAWTGTDPVQVSRALASHRPSIDAYFARIVDRP